MARPRKNQTALQAPERIKNSFWQLLEQHELAGITVSMVVQAAECNRGTFYYHYNSLDELLDQIIEGEMFGSQGIPRHLFCIASGCNEMGAEMLGHLQRCGLMMQRVGRERIEPKIEEIYIGMWKTVLCDGRECLTHETRLVLEFSLSGAMGLIDYMYRNGLLNAEGFTQGTFDLFQGNVRYITSRICATQGIEPTELAVRLRLYYKFLEGRE